MAEVKKKFVLTEEQRQEQEKLKAFLPQYLSEHYGISIGGRNKFFNCLNPDHMDEHPSMVYNFRNNTVHCFACGVTYNLFSLIAMEENLNYGQAIKKAQEYYGDTKPDPKYNNSSYTKPIKRTLLVPQKSPLERKAEVKNILHYLSTWRGINLQEDDEILSSIKFDNKENAIIFVNKYEDEEKTKLESFTKRFINPKDESPRYKNFGNVHFFSQYGYNSSIFKHNSKPIIITEGIIDALSLLSVQRPIYEELKKDNEKISKRNYDVISINGIGNIGSLINDIKSVSDDERKNLKILIAFDGDAPGRKAANELSNALSNMAVQNIDASLFGGAKDINENLLRGINSLTAPIIENLYKINGWEQVATGTIETDTPKEEQKERDMHFISIKSKKNDEILSMNDSENFDESDISNDQELIENEMFNNEEINAESTADIDFTSKLENISLDPINLEMAIDTASMSVSDRYILINSNAEKLDYIKNLKETLGIQITITLDELKEQKILVKDVFNENKFITFMENKYNLSVSDSIASPLTDLETNLMIDEIENIPTSEANAYAYTKVQLLHSAIELLRYEYKSIENPASIKLSDKYESMLNYFSGKVKYKIVSHPYSGINNLALDIAKELINSYPKGISTDFLDPGTIKEKILKGLPDSMMIGPKNLYEAYTPSAIRDKRIFLCWKSVEDGNNESFITFDKRNSPIEDPSKHKCLSFDTACIVAKQINAEGIGINLSGDLVCLNIPNIYDENLNINTETKTILSSCNSYAEYSLDKKSINILVNIKNPEQFVSLNPNINLISNSFHVITGNVVNEQYLSLNNKNSSYENKLGYTSDEIYAACFKKCEDKKAETNNLNKFDEIFNKGNSKAFFSSFEDAERNLIKMVSYYTTDNCQIKDILCNSNMLSDRWFNMINKKDNYIDYLIKDVNKEFKAKADVNPNKNISIRKGR